MITNKELLNIDQNSSNCVELLNDGNKVIYRSDNTLTGEKYLAVFNLTDEALKFASSFTQLGITNPLQINDIWDNKSPSVSQEVAARINPHGVVLFKIKSK